MRTAVPTETDDHLSVTFSSARAPIPGAAPMVPLQVPGSTPAATSKRPRRSLSGAVSLMVIGATLGGLAIGYQDRIRAYLGELLDQTESAPQETAASAPQAQDAPRATAEPLAVQPVVIQETTLADARPLNREAPSVAVPAAPTDATAADADTATSRTAIPPQVASAAPEGPEPALAPTEAGRTGWRSAVASDPRLPTPAARSAPARFAATPQGADAGRAAPVILARSPVTFRLTAPGLAPLTPPDDTAPLPSIVSDGPAGLVTTGPGPALSLPGARPDMRPTAIAAAAARPSVAGPPRPPATVETPDQAVLRTPASLPAPRGERNAAPLPAAAASDPGPQAMSTTFELDASAFLSADGAVAPLAPIVGAEGFAATLHGASGDRGVWLSKTLERMGLTARTASVQALQPAVSSVTFYHAEDETVARAVADQLGAELRDFSGFAPAPPPATIDVYLAD